MLPFAYYLLKVIICSGILFGYYWLLLRNKIYHRYNRFYLLATAVLSLVIPLIQINIWHRVDTPAQSIKLLQVVTGSNEYLDEIVLTARRNNFTAEQVILLLYTVTSIIFCFLFIQVLLKIRTLLKQHQQTIVDNICFVNTTAKGTPFSFLKYIFWNDHIDISTTTGNQIFKHELAHVQQKHSHDKLFINTLLIFFWCNPFFWLIRKELNMIHEFMADKIAVEDSDTEAFAAMILQATYPQHRFALTNPFFYSPIKRRLLMLTKNKNPKAGYIGRVLVLPLAALLFAAFTLKTKTIANIPVYQGKKIKVVLDAGHGGRDFGAVSLDGNISEKDLTLSIIKKIKSSNYNNSIDILFTREDDIYQTPPEKADFSKAQNPDLFVTIHISATTKDSVAIKTGMSVWVARSNYENSSKSKLFASAVINEFANDYKIPVTMLPQQSQKDIWVIQESACPSVLIELGYITNKKDLLYLQTEEAKETIAKNVLAAIEKYAADKSKTGVIPTVIDTFSKDKIKPGKTTFRLNEMTNATLNGEVIILPEKSIIMINGKKIDKSSLINVQFIAEKIEVFSSDNEDAINKFGPDAKYGVMNFINAVVTKENTTNPNFIFVNHKDSLSNKNFTQVKNVPTFPGGDSAWRRYLEKHLDPLAPVDEGWPEGTYKIIVSFKVNKDGSIEDIKTDKYHGSKTADECINLIKKGPRWIPALRNGRNVTAYKKQPITFLIQEQ